MATPSRGMGVVRPPEKGVFPLDHDGQCKGAMKAVMACLKEHKQDHLPCKPLSKAYLECRMQSNLMQAEDWEALGFGKDDAEYARLHEGARAAAAAATKKEEEGFVAGTHVKQRAGGKGIFDWF